MAHRRDLPPAYRANSAEHIKSTWAPETECVQETGSTDNGNHCCAIFVTWDQKTRENISTKYTPARLWGDPLGTAGMQSTQTAALGPSITKIGSKSAKENIGIYDLEKSRVNTVSRGRNFW
ncbi:hypothetical protein BGZ79_000651 [Entomortierella chlamydospora]|nr:hypothetical protein BGZ79_000651 [Entomortierella chlamydospora]